MPAKAAGLSLALGFLSLAGFSFWPVLIFTAAVFAVYFSESPDRKNFRSSFWLLAVFGFLAAGIHSGFAGAPVGWPASAFVAVVFGLMAFGWLGFLNYFFSDRLVVYGVLNAALSAFFFVLAFYFIPDFGGSGAFPVILWFLSVFFVAYLLIRESFVFGVFIRGRELRLASWAFALIMAEVASLASFLPLGFLNAAALLTLLYIIGRDTFLAGFKGLLGFSAVFRELTIFAVVLGLIFATVKWILP